MTADELRQRVDSIIARSNDDEAAHGEEDRLHLELIRVFCPPWVVAEIERLDAADFYRWCG